jgi:signal transduction histidine kinase
MTVPFLPEDQQRDFPHARELAAIGAFWAIFAALNIANWLFPIAGEGPPVNARTLSVGASEWIMWAVATPVIFWLTTRYSIDSGSRARRVVLYLAVGFIAALTIDVVIEVTRTRFVPPPPGRGDFPRGRRPTFGFARGRFFNEYLISLGVLAAGIARDYFRRYQRRLGEAASLRAQLAEARLAALENQLNPHFLFNTLNAVATLVDRDPRGVRKMISRLSELLRATLEPSLEPEVPLSREITLARRYLEILEIRFQGRLTVSVDAPPELGTALVPRLILQPLIENAMKHAASLTSEASRIDVRVERDGYDLVLSVADTGAGSAPSTTGEHTAGAGIGLTNTRARLEQLYGDEQHLTLAPNAAGGTTVTIRLPYHVASERAAAPSGSALARAADVA